MIEMSPVCWNCEFARRIHRGQKTGARNVLWSKQPDHLQSRINQKRPL